MPPPPSLPGPAADPGTRPGLYGQTLVSSGHPDLDRLLGGGLPLGSLQLLLEDGWSGHHATLLRYFLAEGAACGQVGGRCASSLWVLRLFLVGAAPLPGGCCAPSWWVLPYFLAQGTACGQVIGCCAVDRALLRPPRPPARGVKHRRALASAPTLGFQRGAAWAQLAWHSQTLNALVRPLCVVRPVGGGSCPSGRLGGVCSGAAAGGAGSRQGALGRAGLRVRGTRAGWWGGGWGLRGARARTLAARSVTWLAVALGQCASSTAAWPSASEAGADGGLGMSMCVAAAPLRHCHHVTCVCNLALPWHRQRGLVAPLQLCFMPSADQMRPLQDEEEGQEEEFKLRIAWQYRRYIKTDQAASAGPAGTLMPGSSNGGSGGLGASRAPPVAGSMGSSAGRVSSGGSSGRGRKPAGLKDWCHQFDLLKPAGEEGLALCRAELVECSPAAEKSGSGSSGGSGSMQRLLSSAASFVAALAPPPPPQQQQPAVAVALAGAGQRLLQPAPPTAHGPQGVGRLAVLSLGSLGWQAPQSPQQLHLSTSSSGDGAVGGSGAGGGASVLRALLQLKGLVRDRRCVAMVSVPAALFSPSDLARMQHVADGVIALESVADGADIVRRVPASPRSPLQPVPLLPA